MSDQTPLVRPNTYPTTWRTGTIATSGESVTLFPCANDTFFYHIDVLAFTFFFDPLDLTAGCELQWVDSVGNVAPIAGLGLSITGLPGTLEQNQNFTFETSFDTELGIIMKMTEKTGGSSHCSAWAAGYVQEPAW